MSLSELSVSDPGMKQPEAWWSQVQMVLSTAVFGTFTLLVCRTIILLLRKSCFQDDSE